MTEKSLNVVNLTFNEMLSGAEAGHPYKRDSWANDKGYVSMPLGSNVLYNVQLHDGQASIYPANFALADYAATDWREANSYDFPTP